MALLFLSPDMGERSAGNFTTHDVVRLPSYLKPRLTRIALGFGHAGHIGEKGYALAGVSPWPAC